jgi:hypothetical protein
VAGFPRCSVASLYTLTSSTFAKLSFSPRRLRTTPAKNPRTECLCQPVILLIAAIDAPSGRRKRSSTFYCLELARAFGVSVVPIVHRLAAGLGQRFVGLKRVVQKDEVSAATGKHAPH